MNGVDRARDRGNVFWRIVFTVSYRFIRLLDPVIRRAWRATLPGTERIVQLELAGRRTGRPHRTLVTCLSVAGTSYVGHPNGEAGWTRNLVAAGFVRVVESDGSKREARAIRLGPGPERESVVRATWSQQPFPGNLLYSAARGHVRRVGEYFRLESAAP